MLLYIFSCHFKRTREREMAVPGIPIRTRGATLHMSLILICPFFYFYFFLNSFISVFLLCVCFTEETHKNKRIDSRSAVCVCVLYSPKSISISHVSRIGHEMKIFSLLFLFEFCIFSFYFKKKKKKNPAPGPGTDSAYGGHGQPYTHMHLLSLNI